MGAESTPPFLNVEGLGTLTYTYFGETAISGSIVNITSKHDSVDHSHESTGIGMHTPCFYRPYRLS